MKAIYEQAQRVLSWLWEGDESTEQAFHFLEQYASFLNQIEIRESANTWSIPTEEREALLTIFKRPYFTRLWVIQEYAVCGSVCLRCGKNELRIEVFGDALSWLMSYAEIISWGAIDAADASLVVKARYHFRDHGADPDLLYYLYVGLHKSASDPRDKVFALLGLANQSGTVAISADYSTNVQDVYMHVARYVLLTNNDLSIFSFAGLGRADLPRLPSWVPDWTRPPSGMNIERKSTWAFEKEKQFRAHNGMLLPVHDYHEYRASSMSWY